MRALSSFPHCAFGSGVSCTLALWSHLPQGGAVVTGQGPRGLQSSWRSPIERFGHPTPVHILPLCGGKWVSNQGLRCYSHQHTSLNDNQCRFEAKLSTHHCSRAHRSADHNGLAHVSQLPCGCCDSPHPILEVCGRSSTHFNASNQLQ